MRILRVHNRYQLRGGEDVSFEAEASLLESRGHQVERQEFTNDDIAVRQSVMDKAQLAMTTIWSRAARIRIDDAIKSFQPDIVHFDNTFPLVSPAVYSVCNQHRIPAVQSLRNYRLLCPSANFFRDGRVCEDCLGKTPPYPGVMHSCYRGSRAQTSIIAAMLTTHRARRTWSRDVDRYIALTEFAGKKFVTGGIPADLLAIKPNFVERPSRFAEGRTQCMLYVGRLTPEKGINTLLDAWSHFQDVSLEIIGDGPMSNDVVAKTRDHARIAYLGRQPEAITYRSMAQSCAVIVPSEWHEPFGRAVVEAFATGTPVIASRSGGLSELVEDGRTGLLFEPGNVAELTTKVQWAAEHPEEMRRMGENAEREYEEKYTPERNYEILMDIYGQAIEHVRTRSQ